MLVQKMDKEDGIVLSNTGIGGGTLTLDFTNNEIDSEISKNMKQTVEVDEYFPHRNCKYVWGDSDGDGDEECLVCGQIKFIEEN